MGRDEFLKITGRIVIYAVLHNCVERVVNSLLNGKPMKIIQNQSDVFKLALSRDDSGCIIIQVKPQAAVVIHCLPQAGK